MAVERSHKEQVNASVDAIRATGWQHPTGCAARGRGRMCFDVPFWWCLIAYLIMLAAPFALAGGLIIAVAVGISRLVRRRADGHEAEVAPHDR